MRASSSLELAETSMVKNLQKKSSNGLDNNCQWIQDVQKPLAGFLRHLNRPKDEEVRPPPFSSFKLVVSASTKRTLLV
jgi:hypothetical protein